VDFRFSPEEEAFRAEFESWLPANLPDGWNTSIGKLYDSHDEWSRDHREFHRKLFEAGYSGMHYPKEYGGQGRSLAEEVIVLEAIAANAVELRLPGLITFGMTAPTLLLCGTEEQKKEFIPKLLDGTHVWCQGFSEPNAGSDVVNVATRADRDGDYYVVNGQKCWTSYAHMSDWCLLLVRTDPKAPKHKGLSYLLMDMTLPGVEVRPIRQITGEAEFNEIFLDNVRIPADLLVGGEGQGWRIAITTLMFERALGDILMGAYFERRARAMIEMAGRVKRSGQPVIEDTAFRQRLAREFIEVQVVKHHGYRSISQMFNGGIPGAEGSIGKLLWSLHSQRASETALAVQGPFSQLMHGSPFSVDDGVWQYGFLTSKGTTIAAGTTEINKNIVAERILGLPKDAARGQRQ
jgi:alkylation response protein AidB-like acyl-CoA dehydrogenase